MEISWCASKAGFANELVKNGTQWVHNTILFHGHHSDQAVFVHKPKKNNLTQINGAGGRPRLPSLLTRTIEYSPTQVHTDDKEVSPHNECILVFVLMRAQRHADGHGPLEFYVVEPLRSEIVTRSAIPLLEFGSQTQRTSAWGGNYDIPEDVAM